MARCCGAAFQGTLLVVEDEPLLASSFKTLLEYLGYKVHVAQDAASALVVLGSIEVDVVLCDIKLPGQMSGLDLAAVIKRDPDLKDLPLVAVTGYGQPQDRARTSTAGFDAHLAKPVEVPVLQGLLRDFISPV